MIGALHSQSVGTFTSKYCAASKDGSTVAKCYVMPGTTLTYQYTGTTADTCNGAFLWAKSVDMSIYDKSMMPSLSIKVNGATSSSATIGLYGKMYLTDSVWTAIGTTTFTGNSGSDSIINIVPAATPIPYSYPYWQSRVTNLITGGTKPITIRYAYFRFRKY